MKGDKMEQAIQSYLQSGGKITVLPSNEKPFKLVPKKSMKETKVCCVKRIFFGKHKLLVKVK